MEKMMEPNNDETHTLDDFRKGLIKINFNASLFSKSRG